MISKESKSKQVSNKTRIHYLLLAVGGAGVGSSLGRVVRGAGTGGGGEDGDVIDDVVAEADKVDVAGLGLVLCGVVCLGLAGGSCCCC